MSSPQTPGDRALRIREAPHPLLRILELARVLRAPDGCSWDRAQTVETLTPYLQEETFEVVEAVSDGEAESFREELGDLLFLVMSLAEAGEARGWGNLETVADGVVEKLVRRHPHVFAEERGLEEQGALRQWEELKRREKEAQGGEEASTTLGRRPRGLPALTAAYRISEKAAAVGFQWPSVRDALHKLHEEVDELQVEVEGRAPLRAVEDELGDILYSVVNICRYLGLDPERALRGTTEKFTRRFRYIEDRLRERGRTPATSSLEEMDGLWTEAKGVLDPAAEDRPAAGGD